MTATIPERKWGWGQAPDNPSPPRVTIDAAWTPRQLSLALIRANWKRLAVASLLLIMHGVASMLMPTVVGCVVDDVATPAYEALVFRKFPGRSTSGLEVWLFFTSSCMFASGVAAAPVGWQFSAHNMNCRRQLLKESCLPAVLQEISARRASCCQ